jgi:hypothetical protein
MAEVETPNYRAAMAMDMPWTTTSSLAKRDLIREIARRTLPERNSAWLAASSSHICDNFTQILPAVPGMAGHASIGLRAKFCIFP